MQPNQAHLEFHQNHYIESGRHSFSRPELHNNNPLYDTTATPTRRKTHIPLFHRTPKNMDTPEQHRAKQNGLLHSKNNPINNPLYSPKTIYGTPIDIEEIRAHFRRYPISNKARITTRHQLSRHLTNTKAEHRITNTPFPHL